MAVLPLLYLSSLLSLLALGSPPEQLVLNSDSVNQSGGVLRRFQVHNSQDVEDVLAIANDNDLDIWQVGRSHVDIYSPSSSAIPTSLNEYPHTENYIPTQVHPLRTAGTPAEWDLTSLENSTFHSSYHPLYEVDEFINEIVALHPDVATRVSLGHSGEGREMFALTLSRPGLPDPHTKITRKQCAKCKIQSNKKLGFVISGAQHAREWVATASALYITHALLSNASEPHSLSHLLDQYDFHIIPSPNPDGYDWTWTGGRFWYKNRQALGPDTTCLGIDMNRNWGYKWDPYAYDTGLKRNKKKSGHKHPPLAEQCSNWYPGERAFESPEVNNIANFVERLPNLVAFTDLRSYGQMLTPPYSYTCDRMPKDAEDLFEAALGATSALFHVHGTEFETGSLCSMLYRAPGNIVDWMYARAGIKYSYAVHLRDTGTYGFSLPAQWIRPVGEETAKLIEYIARFIVKNQK